MGRPVASVVLPLLAAQVAAHGAVTSPPPRNAIDGDLAPWGGAPPEAMPFMFWCASPLANSTPGARNVTGRNGQACFWFNNGCDISCDKCDGQTGQAIHPRFLNPEGAPFPAWDGENLKFDADFQPVKGRPDGSTRLSICPNPLHRPTICDPALRTLNILAPCGSPEDVFQFAPWRAPGAAPVIDSCGVAGGVLAGQGAAAAGGDYKNNTKARRSDRGSMLPPAPSGTVWAAGSVVEVAWTRKAWHGGGYQYRLCPAGQPLDEDCFQRRPLPFADGTRPSGSTWRRSPLPRGPWDWEIYGPSPLPVCDEPAECRGMEHQPDHPSGHSSDEGAFPCTCSGSGVGDLYNLEVVDALRLPSDLPAGEWVLGWRWDCEESTQVWSSCSDVSIVAADAAPQAS